MKKFSPWLWTGGVIAVATMGALRFLGKGTNIFGLLAGMAVVITSIRSPEAAKKPLPRESRKGLISPYKI